MAQPVIVVVIRDDDPPRAIEDGLDDDEQAAVPAHRGRPHGHVALEVVNLDVGHVVDHGRVADLGAFRKAAGAGRANDRGDLIGTGQLRALELVDPDGVPGLQDARQGHEAGQIVAEHDQFGVGVALLDDPRQALGRLGVHEHHFRLRQRQKVTRGR